MIKQFNDQLKKDIKQESLFDNQPALHRKMIKEGKLTEEESKRIVDEANYRDSFEEELEED